MSPAPKPASKTAAARRKPLPAPELQLPFEDGSIERIEVAEWILQEVDNLVQANVRLQLAREACERLPDHDPAHEDAARAWLALEPIARKMREQLLRKVRQIIGHADINMRRTDAGIEIRRRAGAPARKALAIALQRLADKSLAVTSASVADHWPHEVAKLPGDKQVRRLLAELQSDPDASR